MQTKDFIDTQFLALGTINYIRVYDHTDENVLRMAIDRVKVIEERMSSFLSDSDIMKMNERAGRDTVSIHEDTMNVLKAATYYSELSQGAFDVTIRPLVELWGIGKKNNYIPTQQDINEALKLVEWKSVIIKEDLGVAGLRNAGQKIDLGGIAKGYAADEVKRILQDNNIKNAMINMGGNIVTMGHSKGEELWKIGIQNPMAPTGSYLGVLTLSEKTIVTSGSNERFFMKDGIRYHHLLNPLTGKPAQSGLLSVTVVSDCSMEADALTTALFVMGLEQGVRFLKNFDAEAVFITENLGIYLTEGLKDYFTTTQKRR